VSEAIPLFPIYIFMACEGKARHLPCVMALPWALYVWPRMLRGVSGK